jgi:hypothetical protein
MDQGYPSAKTARELSEGESTIHGAVPGKKVKCSIMHERKK